MPSVVYVRMSSRELQNALYLETLRTYFIFIPKCVIKLR
jgi:hypothetical protein